MNITLKIFDTLILPRNGKYILCCVDPSLDHLSDKQVISDLNNRELYLYIGNKFIKSLRVCNVETSSSIIGKKNIYLLIDDDISSLHNIKEGYLKLVKG
jgi:hypothetical protein